MKRETEEFTLKELFLLFLPKLWLIILCGVIFAGAIGAYSVFLKDDTYTSSATIYVYKERANDTASNSYYDSITSQKMVKTYSIVLKSNSFLEKVISGIEDAEEYSLTPEKIKATLQIKQVDETEVFDVYYTSKNEELTYKVLSEITVLAQTEIKNMVSSTASDVKIIDEPIMPKAPDSKHVVRNALIGFIAGVVVSMVVIFLFDQFDVVIHNKKKIEDNFDIPVLGVIPRQGATVKTSGGGNDGV